MIRSRWMAATAFGALLLAVAPALAQTAQPVAAAAAPAEAPSRGLSLRDMAMMERVSDPRVSPDGRHYYPAFPFTSYALMGDQDLVDLLAYLKTLPAVSGRIADHDLHFPFSFRR